MNQIDGYAVQDIFRKSIISVIHKMRVTFGLFITLALFLNSIELSSQADLRELFPATAHYGNFLPPIQKLRYVDHREQLRHLRRLDENDRTTAFQTSSVLQARGPFVIGWVMRGILSPLYGSPGIYNVNGTKVQLTPQELDQLGVNHIFSFVRWIDNLAAQRQVMNIQGEAALTVKIAAHYEASCVAHFRAMRQSNFEKDRLQPLEGRTNQISYQESLVVIRQAYNEAYNVTLQNYLRLRGHP